MAKPDCLCGHSKKSHYIEPYKGLACPNDMCQCPAYRPKTKEYEELDLKMCDCGHSRSVHNTSFKEAGYGGMCFSDGCDCSFFFKKPRNLKRIIVRRLSPRDEVEYGASREELYALAMEYGLVLHKIRDTILDLDASARTLLINLEAVDPSFLVSSFWSKQEETKDGDSNDNVNHPKHYTSYNGLEIIDLTEQMNFNRGNAVKYIARAGIKSKDSEIQDLEKAAWYINREIKRIKDGGDLK